MENVTSTQKGGHSQKFVLMLAAMVLLTGIVIVSIIRDRIVNNQIWQTSVIGQGKVIYQPDIAIVNLGVQIDKADKAESALKQLNEKMDKIMVAIKGIGILPENIQTQNYSVYPQYDYVDGISNLVGYNANQQLNIKVKNLKEDQEAVSKVIGEATKAGANQILGITFDVSNLEELKQEARLKAVADAKSKAVAMADAAGVRLDKVIGWWENYVSAPGTAMYYADGKGGAGGVGGGPVPTGEREIIIEVNLNYKIK